MKLKNLLFASGWLIMSSMACNSQKNTDTEAVTLATFEDSLNYSLGVNVSMGIKMKGFDTINVKIFSKAIDDVYNNNTLLLDEMASRNVLNSHFQKAQEKQMEMQQKQQSMLQEKLQETKNFLEENRENAKKELLTLPSGMQVMILKEGDGPNPKATDNVTTHYHGMLEDGSVFDSSVDRGQPAKFPVNGVIQGWQEALQLMKVGAKWKLVIPPNLAYGAQGAGNAIPPNATLTFEVELLSID